jgi:nicotinamidase-related amidase
MRDLFRPATVERPVLVVIDVQRDWALPSEEAGIGRMDGVSSVVATIERLVDAARQAQVPVIFLQECHRRSGIDFGRELDGAEGPHCLEGAPGTALWPTLEPLESEPVVVKRRYSGFFATDLDIVLRGFGADGLVLVGGLTDVCVHYTFVDAHQLDYRVRVVEDAVVGSSVAAHRSALEAMAYLQRGAVTTAEAVVAALAGGALRSVAAWGGSRR